MTSRPRAVTYIGLEENTFGLNLENKTFAWCIIPRDSQKQLLCSDLKVVITRINVKKEKHLIRMGFCLN